MRTWLGDLSMLCAAVTCALCTWAVFSKHFDDTLVQRLGLSIMAVGTAVRVWDRLANDVPDPPLVLLWSQVGLALYAAATAVKLYQAGRRVGVERRHPDRRGLELLR